MARIKITPEQVRTAAGKFKTEAGNSQTMVKNLEGTINGMQGEWEGMTKERFFQDFEGWKRTMTQFVELLNGISKQLEQIATRFEQADKG